MSREINLASELREAWKEVVTTSNIAPVGYDEETQKLTVRCDNPAAHSLLRLAGPNLIERLNATLPAPIIRSVTLTLRTVRILTTGSREHRDTQLIEDALLDSWHDAVQIYGHGVRVAFVEGACPDGADPIVHRWARTHEAYGIVSERLEADWDHCAPNCPPGPGHRRRKKPGDTAHPGKLDDFCPSAGPRRNAELVRRGAYLCLGFPLGRSYGTRNCMKLARAAGIPVREVTR